jgi:hypothetical protein
MRRKLLTCAFCFICLIVVPVGCGNGSSTDSSGSSQPSGATGGSGTTKSSDAKPGKADHPGFSESELARFGKEASQSELEAASEVLAENLEARETKDWAGQCASLSAQVVKRVESERPPVGAKPGCAARLEEQAPGAPAVVFRDTLAGGQIDALRSKDNKAFLAIFHGTDGRDYEMPMKMEDGEWKVDALTLIILG